MGLTLAIWLHSRHGLNRSGKLRERALRMVLEHQHE